MTLPTQIKCEVTKRLNPIPSAPNVLYLKMTTLASKEHDTALKCRKRQGQFAYYKKNKTSPGALFCTEVQQKEVMSVPVQLLHSQCPLCTSPLHKPDRTFCLLSADLRNSSRQQTMLYPNFARDQPVVL